MQEFQQGLTANYIVADALGHFSQPYLGPVAPTSAPMAIMTGHHSQPGWGQPHIPAHLKQLWPCHNKKAYADLRGNTPGVPDSGDKKGCDFRPHRSILHEVILSRPGDVTDYLKHRNKRARKTVAKNKTKS